MTGEDRCVEVTEDLVRDVAAVSRLHLRDVEISVFTKDFDEILNACKALDEVDTKEVTPRFHPIDVANVMRDDVVKPSLSQEDALKNAVHKKDGYFKGPKVV